MLKLRGLEVVLLLEQRQIHLEPEAILGELEYEAPPGTGDKARAAKDSAYLEDSFQDAVAKATAETVKVLLASGSVASATATPGEQPSLGRPGPRW